MALMLCRFCGHMFFTEGALDRHEKKCTQNPANK